MYYDVCKGVIHRLSTGIVIIYGNTCRIPIYRETRGNSKNKKGKKFMKMYKCLRCFYQWKSKILGTPKQCPRCKQTRYYMPAREVKNKLLKKPKYAQRLHFMQVGDTVIFPWINTDGKRDFVKNHTMYRAIQNFCRDSFMKFFITNLSSGISVFRKE